MTKKQFLLLAATTSMLALSGCFESESDDTNTRTNSENAAVEAATANEAAAPTQEAVQVAASLPEISGSYCGKILNQQLSATMLSDPEAGGIRFRFSTFNLETEHECGMGDTLARQTGSNIWTYELDEPGYDCTVTVSMDGGNIVLANQSDCSRYFCGARARFDTITITPDMQINDAALINGETGALELPSCE